MDLSKTMILVDRAKQGDEDAREELYRRILPKLERFAHGRIPLSMRRMADTQEVVAEAVFRSLRKLDGFVPHHEGAFMQYLGRIVINRIRDLARRKHRENAIENEQLISGDELSPVEQAVGTETFTRYREALETLKDDQRTAVMLHVEMGYAPKELAEALGRTPDAARKVLCRGLENMAGKMKAHR